jgi:hypothetical protein
MKIEKIKEITIPVVENNTPPYSLRPIPAGAFSLHRVCMMIGGIGSGKTTKLMEFLNWVQKGKSPLYDRVIYFSPTAHRENKTKTYINKDHNFELQHYPKYEDSILGEEMALMKGNIDEWNMEQKFKKAWDDFCHCKSTDELDFNTLMLLEEMGWVKPQIKWKYYPTHLVIIDDCVGEKIFNNSCRGMMTQFLTTLRHYSSSCFILSQVFKAYMPLQLRGGVVNLWVLFGTKSEKHKDSIAEELASKCDPELFKKVWGFCCEDQHDALVVDYLASSEKYMFRRNWNNKIVLDE